MPAVTGQPAPDFTLASTSGELVTLSSFQGRHNVLVAFFPLAFTGVCTAEVCALSNDYEKFTALGAHVLPVSVDAVPSLKAFKKQEQLTIDLLSDFKRDASRAYGVLDEAKFHARRSYFLVDRSGLLRWSHVEEVNANRRPDEELLAEIAKL